MIASVSRPSRGPRCDRLTFLRAEKSVAVRNSLSSLSTKKQKQINVFVDYLLSENEKYNLTAVRSRDEAIIRHAHDSLALLDVLDEYLTPEQQTGAKVIDVGSGPGLPGLIIAIARPEWSVTCLDSIKKRIKFVDSAASLVGISNAIPLCGRAEEIGVQNEHRGKYDVVVARAVAELPTQAELCLPLSSLEGFWVAAKGPGAEVEVERSAEAIKVLGGEVRDIVLVNSYSAEGQRTAVVIQKTGDTPSKYPRRPGMPKKKPLCL